MIFLFPTPQFLKLLKIFFSTFQLLKLILSSFWETASSRVHLNFVMNLLYMMIPCYGSRINIFQSTGEHLYSTRTKLPPAQWLISNSKWWQILREEYKGRVSTPSLQWSVNSRASDVTGSMENSDLCLPSKWCFCNSVFIWSLWSTINDITAASKGLSIEALFWKGEYNTFLIQSQKDVLKKYLFHCFVIFSILSM